MILPRLAEASLIARKQAAKKKGKNGVNLGFKAKPRSSADAMQNNMDPVEYKHLPWKPRQITSVVGRDG